MNLGVVTVSDVVVSDLRARLLAGEIAAGTELRDTDLAERFGVARPTVRAAVASLVTEGLLERSRGQSARVRSFTAADAVDLYRLRGAVETAAVRLVVEIGAPLEGIRDALGRFTSLPDDASWALATAADVAFHRSVFVSSGSPRLLSSWDGISSEHQLLIAHLRPAYGGVHELAAEHTVLLDALSRSVTARDPEPAIVAWAKHLADAQAFYLTLMETTP